MHTLRALHQALNPSLIWRDRTLTYRRAAAEVLHAIRNGHAKAWEYRPRMELLAAAEAEGRLPARFADPAAV